MPQISYCEHGVRMKTFELGLVVLLGLTSCCPCITKRTASSGINPESSSDPDVSKAVKRELKRKVSYEFNDVLISEVLLEFVLTFECQVFVDATGWDSDRKITLKVENVEACRVLDAVVKDSGLEWAAFAEAIYVATPKQIQLAKGITALDSIEKDDVRKKLARQVCVCHPGGDKVHHGLVALLGQLGNLKVRTRLPESKDKGARFTYMDHRIQLKNALRWIAVNWGMDLKVEDEVIVFVPRIQTTKGK